MAKTDCSLQQPKSGKSDEKRPKLEYLEFVVVAALHAVMLAGKLYAFAKERSGRIQPAVSAVEGSVVSVFVPMYSKFRHLPIRLLVFVDRKVDDCVTKVHSRLPPSLKHAQSVMVGVKNAGMVGTAKKVFAKYEPVTEEYALHAWRFLNQYFLFQKAAQAAAPVAGYCSEMYNRKVLEAGKSGYRVASRLPLIPIEKLVEALRTEDMKPIVIDGEEVGAK